jgi:excisionase family DNA binding protein
MVRASDGENIVLEINDAQPMSFVPQLMSEADVASRLHISIRKVAQIAHSGRLPVVRVDGAVRFREEDVRRILTEHQVPRPRLLALPARVRSHVSCTFNATPHARPAYCLYGNCWHLRSEPFWTEYSARQSLRGVYPSLRSGDWMFMFGSPGFISWSVRDKP